MSIVFTIIGIITAICFAVSNIYVAKTMSAGDMLRKFIRKQCLVGKIFTNFFYAPAWCFKGLRFVVLTTIK